MTEEQQAEFNYIAKLMIEWLCNNVHPHHTVIITPTYATLNEGVVSTGEILEYVKG